MENLDKVALLHLTTQMDDESLAKFCQTNKRNKDFCLTNNILWQQRLIKYLGKYYQKIDKDRPVLEIINDFRQENNMTWRNYYISTMTLLDNCFIKLEDCDERNDTSQLEYMMKKEPFYIYDNTMYQNKVIPETLYSNLDETDKRWVSKDVMIYHILIGNIKDEKNIREILYQGLRTDTFIDVIMNTDVMSIDRQGGRIILDYLDYLIRNNNFLSKILFVSFKRSDPEKYSRILKETRRRTFLKIELKVEK